MGLIDTLPKIEITASSKLVQDFGEIQKEHKKAHELNFSLVSNKYLQVISRYIDETGKAPYVIGQPVFGKSLLPTERTITDIDERNNPICQAGATLDYITENIERQEEKQKSPAEWRQLEYEYVECANYTIEDAYDDYRIMYEQGTRTKESTVNSIMKLQECDYVFCLNVFSPRNEKHRFCCRNHKEKQKGAKKRFEKTATYLPARAWKRSRDETVEKEYEKREIAFDNLKLQELIIEGVGEVTESYFNDEKNPLTHGKLNCYKKDIKEKTQEKKKIRTEEARKEELSSKAITFNYKNNTDRELKQYIEKIIEIAAKKYPIEG